MDYKKIKEREIKEKIVDILLESEIVLDCYKKADKIYSLLETYFAIQK